MKVSKLEKLFKEAYELGNQNAVQPRKKKGPINVAFKKWFVEQSKKSIKSNKLDSALHDIERPFLNKIVVLEGELSSCEKAIKAKNKMIAVRTEKINHATVENSNLIQSCNSKNDEIKLQSDHIKNDTKIIERQKNRIFALQEQLDERDNDINYLKAKVFNSKKELEKSFNKTQLFLMGVLGSIIGGVGIYFYFA